MKKKGKSGKRIPRFYVIYFTVTIIIILLVMVGLWVVRSRLAEYEAVQPKYVAAEVFARYFDPIDYNELLADARYDAGEVDVWELAEYLKSEIGGEELTYAVGSSNDPNEVKYIVKAGSKQLAAIALNVSDRKTEHGYDTYDFSYIDLYLNMDAYLEELAKFVVTVEAPASYSVMVDGEILSEELITSVYPRKDIMKFYPEDVEEIEYVVYTITTLRELPESVVVLNSEGVEAEVELDQDSHAYTCGLAYSEALAEEYTDFVINAMEGYAAYVQAAEDVGLNDIKSYFDTGSDAYADVVAAGGNRWMVNEWSGIDFENVNAGEFYVHTPEIFSCHVTLTQLLHRAGREDFVDVIDMYLFLHQTEKGYKIYEWFNAS